MKQRELIESGDYATYAPNDAWMDVVNLVSRSRGRKVKLCRSHFFRWDCSGSLGHSGVRPVMCRERDLCYICGRSYAEKETVDAVKCVRALYEAAGKKLGRSWMIDGTVPLELRRKVAFDGGLALRHLWRRTINEVFNDEGRYEFFAFESFQWWHSYKPGRKNPNPFRDYMPHVHLLIPGLVYDKLANEYVEFSFWMDDKGKKLRAVWRRNLAAYYGEFKSKDVVVWIGPVKAGWTNFSHSLEYLNRNPVVDFYKASVAGMVDTHYSGSAFGGLSPPLMWAKEALLRPKNERSRERWGGMAPRRLNFHLLRLRGRCMKPKAKRMAEETVCMCPHKVGSDVQGNAMLCGLVMHPSDRGGGLLTLDEVQSHRLRIVRSVVDGAGNPVDWVGAVGTEER